MSPCYGCLKFEVQVAGNYCETCRPEPDAQLPIPHLRDARPAGNIPDRHDWLIERKCVIGWLQAVAEDCRKNNVSPAVVARLDRTIAAIASGEHTK